MSGSLNIPKYQSRSSGSLSLHGIHCYSGCADIGRYLLQAQMLSLPFPSPKTASLPCDGQVIYVYWQESHKCTALFCMRSGCAGGRTEIASSSPSLYPLISDSSSEIFGLVMYVRISSIAAYLLIVSSFMVVTALLQYPKTFN